MLLKSCNIAGLDNTMALTIETFKQLLMSSAKVIGAVCSMILELVQTAALDFSYLDADDDKALHYQREVGTLLQWVLFVLQWVCSYFSVYVCTFVRTTVVLLQWFCSY